MDISKLSLEDLAKLKEQISQREDNILEVQKRARKEASVEFINFLRANREVILNLFEHTKDDCDDSRYINGYVGEDISCCPKCHLIEVLDEVWVDGTFEVEFNMTITEIK